MAPVTFAQQLDKYLDSPRVQESILSIPDYQSVGFAEYPVLQEELDALKSNLAQRKGFLGINKQMTSEQIRIHEIRIAELDAKLKGLVRVAQAIQGGYEPYHPPSDWYAGFAEDVSDKYRNSFDRRQDPLNEDITIFSLSLTFATPMPKTTLIKYDKAKRTGVFKTFIVAAPDKSLFVQGSLFCEPALIGYIPVERSIGFGQPMIIGEYPSREIDIQPGLYVQGAVGFLIDMWNLEKDRKFAGIN